MGADRKLNRRVLSQNLSRVSNASVDEIIATFSAAPKGAGSYRLGFTGPPGAGKSSVIAELVKHRLRKGNMVGVLAIDPSSPITKGSLLGDRVRMDAVAADQGLFIRSLASKSAHDGLANNIADLIAVMEQSAFDDVVIETVGAGQADHAVRIMVDTVVLVLLPGAGDAIQAIKAGILEIADIYVINKADLPEAARLANEIEAMLKYRQDKRTEDWSPKVIRTSTVRGTGIENLDAAIEERREWLTRHSDREKIRRARAKYQLKCLISRRADEVLDMMDADSFDWNLREAYSRVVAGLRVEQN